MKSKILNAQIGAGIEILRLFLSFPMLFDPDFVVIVLVVGGNSGFGCLDFLCETLIGQVFIMLFY